MSNTTAATRGWDDGAQKPGVWDGWLTVHGEKFDAGTQTLKQKLDDAFKKLAGDGTTPGDPTNPQVLAEYQTAMSEYTTYRSLQSNSAKALSDMQKQNARNLG